MDSHEFALILGRIDGKLEALKTDVAEVKDLQKIANGRTSKNSADIGTLQTKMAGVLWTICAIVTATLVAVAKRFIG